MPKPRARIHSTDQVFDGSTRASRPSPVLRRCGRALALAFRVIPHRRRFRTAVGVAALLEPLISRSTSWTERARLRTDTIRETTLEVVLMMLTRHGTTFDPVLEIVGTDALPPPSTPLLVVGPHTMLSRLFVRHLEDAGYCPAVIEVAPHFTPGSRLPERVLYPSRTLLLKVHRVLRAHGTVAGMIDRDRPEARSRTLLTNRGETFISEAVLQVALRAGARIVFIATTLTPRRQVRVRLQAVPSDVTRADEAVALFVKFVDASLQRNQVHLRGSRAGAAASSSPA